MSGTPGLGWTGSAAPAIGGPGEAEGKPPKKKTKGRIEIDYYSSEDLDRLLILLGLTDDL